MLHTILKPKEGLAQRPINPLLLPTTHQQLNSDSFAEQFPSYSPRTLPAFDVSLAHVSYMGAACGGDCSPYAAQSDPAQRPRPALFLLYIVNHSAEGAPFRRGEGGRFVRPFGMSPSGQCQAYGSITAQHWKNANVITLQGFFPLFFFFFPSLYLSRSQLLKLSQAEVTG